MSPTSRPDPNDPGSADQAARLRAELERSSLHAATSQAEYDELLADPGVLQEDRDAAALLLEHARRQVESAQAALEHFEAGEYGRCASCGRDIGEARLAALVDVTTCVDCAG
jgi:DnaK suppressor protein